MSKTLSISLIAAFIICAVACSVILFKDTKPDAQAPEKQRKANITKKGLNTAPEENISSVKTKSTSSDNAKAIDKIREVLPEGWAVKEKDGKVTIEKNKPVAASPIADSLNYQNDPFIKYNIPFWSCKYFTPEEYKATAKRNEEVRQSADLFYKQNIMSSIPCKMFKGDKYFQPKSKKDKETVREHEEILSKVVWLPNVYLGQEAFTYYKGKYSFKNKADEEEYKRVTEKVLNLFTKYEETK